MCSTLPWDHGAAYAANTLRDHSSIQQLQLQALTALPGVSSRLAYVLSYLATLHCHHRMRYSCLPCADEFFPLKLYSMAMSRSRGLLLFGEHVNWPARDTQRLSVPLPASRILSRHMQERPAQPTALGLMAASLQ